TATRADQRQTPSAARGWHQLRTFGSATQREQALPRRVEVALKRLRWRRESEQLVGTAPQPVAPRRLLVRHAHGQLLDPFDLVVGDGAISLARAHERVPFAPQGLQQLVELGACDES